MSAIRTLAVPGDAAGLDRFLADALPEFSRAFLQRCIADGRVRVDGRVVTKSGTALPGAASVAVDLPAPPPDGLEPETIPLDLAYEDAHLAVVLKPAGPVVHPLPQLVGRHEALGGGCGGEPFSGLDPINQALLNDILQDLRKAGRSVIFSTHVMHQAEQLCDDICLIDRGRVVLSGELSGFRAGFGRETAKLEFAGDASALDGIPGIRVVERLANSAEVLITHPSRLSAFVADIASRLDLRLFERRGPSLNAIFLEMVGRPRAGEGERAS